MNFAKDLIMKLQLMWCPIESTKILKHLLSSRPLEHFGQSLEISRQVVMKNCKCGYLAKVIRLLFYKCYII